MPRNLLSEPEAWRLLGRKILRERYIDYGICREVYFLYASGVISRQRRVAMLARIVEHQHTAKSLREQWPKQGRYWKDRGMFCLMLAEESKRVRLQRTRVR